jgi:hypothetical protein
MHEDVVIDVEMFGDTGVVSEVFEHPIMPVTMAMKKTTSSVRNPIMATSV